MVSDTTCCTWPTSLLIRDISWPVVRCAKKPADWPRMWRYSALRRSMTTRWPTLVVRYDDT